MTNQELKVTTIAKVNDVSIVVLPLDDDPVVIKPLCEAIGIDIDSQRQKLRKDPILSSFVFLTKATGTDGKIYNMLCLPLKYMFGWIFSINPERVNEKSRESVIKYKKECYDVLYEYLTSKKSLLTNKL